MRIIRKTIKADLEEVFNLIYVSFSNMAESDLVKQLISDEDVLINLLIETLFLENIFVILDKIPGLSNTSKRK